MISDTEKYKVPARGQYDFKKIPLEDPMVWAAFSRGETVGVFQLEKQLGQDWSRKLKPQNIEQLSALVAILRPACLESGLAESYCKRKNGQEPSIPFHPALEEILRDTFNCSVYQEQSIEIGKKLAGMSEEDADTYIRKGIGKKVAAIIAECKIRFLEGCKKQNIVTEKEAQEIFSWLEKAQRYQFNKCLSLDTVVETPNGYRLVSELKNKDQVKNHKNKFVEVKDVIDNGVQELFEVELESGKTIKCTINHKFLCKDNRIRPLYEIIYENHEIMCED